MKFSSFAGIIPGSIEEKSDIFKCTLDNYPEYFYETVQEYEHGPDCYNGIDYSFKYKYVIQIRDYCECDPAIDQENGFGAALYLAVSPESMMPEKRMSIAECFGYEDDPGLLHYDDVVTDGFGVMMGHTPGILRGEEWDGFSEEEISEVVNLIANCLDAIDGMRGF